MFETALFQCVATWWRFCRSGHLSDARYRASVLGLGQEARAAQTFSVHQLAHFVQVNFTF